MEADLGTQRTRGASAGAEISRGSIFATVFLNLDSLARTSVRCRAPPIAAKNGKSRSAEGESRFR